MHLYILLIVIVGALATPTLAAGEGLSTRAHNPPSLKAGATVRKASRHVTRVRAADARVAAALAEGRERSASFRAVLNRIDELDVIVYAETQPALRGRLSGSMTWVIATKDFRYVRVSLNRHLSMPQLVAMLAHELQHVVEVGEAPSVVDNRTLSDYYRAAGHAHRTTSDEWDTEAARRTAEIVRRELAATPAGVAESIQTRRFDAER